MALFRPWPDSPAGRLEYSLLVLIRVSLLVAATWAVVIGKSGTAGMSLLSLGLTFLPRLVEHRYKIQLPIEFHLIIVLFIYASIFLGSANGAYVTFGWWDIVLHIGSGLILGFLGFMLLYVLHAQKKLEMSYFLIAFFTFCVGMALGVMWEFYEFGVDQLLGKEMQHGNFDTMTDLLTDAVGALLIAIGGYYHLKRNSVGLVSRAINSFMHDNPRLRR